MIMRSVKLSAASKKDQVPIKLYELLIELI